MYFIFSVGRSGYVVRILNPETATRALIRGFSGRISDLAFAHKDSTTLACVDEGGNLYIWNVSEENQSLGYPGYCKCCLVCSWVVVVVVVGLFIMY